jgi:hypothetical protein
LLQKYEEIPLNGVIIVPQVSQEPNLDSSITYILLIEYQHRITIRKPSHFDYLCSFDQKISFHAAQDTKNAKRSLQLLLNSVVFGVITTRSVSKIIKN